jgi:hypothetical protein
MRDIASRIGIKAYTSGHVYVLNARRLIQAIQLFAGSGIICVKIKCSVPDIEGPLDSVGCISATCAVLVPSVAQSSVLPDVPAAAK